MALDPRISLEVKPQTFDYVASNLAGIKATGQELANKKAEIELPGVEADTKTKVRNQLWDTYKGVHANDWTMEDPDGSGPILNVALANEQLARDGWADKVPEMAKHYADQSLQKLTQKKNQTDYASAMMNVQNNTAAQMATLLQNYDGGHQKDAYYNFLQNLKMHYGPDHPVVNGFLPELPDDPKERAMYIGSLRTRAQTPEIITKLENETKNANAASQSAATGAAAQGLEAKKFGVNIADSIAKAQALTAAADAMDADEANKGNKVKVFVGSKLGTLSNDKSVQTQDAGIELYNKEHGTNYKRGDPGLSILLRRGAQTSTQVASQAVNTGTTPKFNQTTRPGGTTVMINPNKPGKIFNIPSGEVEAAMKHGYKVK